LTGVPASELCWPELGWPELGWPELGWPELGWPELSWPVADRAPDEDVDVMASFVSRR
jgi:hypothetical protein